MMELLLTDEHLHLKIMCFEIELHKTCELLTNVYALNIFSSDLLTINN